MAIIQARLGSTRLPGKVLMDLEGATMLERVVNRTRRARRLDDVVIATTIREQDDQLVEACHALGIAVYRGDENDVLSRYYGAAVASRAEAIVRITSDCPLIDPEVVDRVVEAFWAVQPDYAANILERTYPRGLDTEIFSFTALSQAQAECTDAFQREHVTDFIYDQPQRFRHVSVKNETDCSDGRWTVDTPEDLELIRCVYRHFEGRDTMSWKEVWDYLQSAPEVNRINRHVRQKTREDAGA